MDNLLLLISSNPADESFAKEVATEAGLTLKVVPTPKEGAEVINSDNVATIFVDASTEAQYQAFEAAIQETVGLFSEKINANTIHFLSSEDLEKTSYIIQSPMFGSFVIREYGDVKESGPHYGRIVKNSLKEKSFGLAPLMKSGLKVQTIKFKSTSQKYSAIEAIKSYLLAAQFQTRIVTVISNAVDELVMNAMFDAPTDALGKPTLTMTPRSTVIALEGQSAVDLNVGFDGNYVGISVVDYFGSLDKAKLLSHISKVYRTEEYKVKTSVAGAGIGLATVFRLGASLSFVCESRTQTQVSVFFKRTDNFRDFKNQFRFISNQFYL